MLVLTVCIILFHLLIVAKIIPYNIVWGGRLTSDAEMIQFEAVSIAINFLILLVVAIKGEYIRLPIPSKIITVLLWLFFGMMIANTIANLFSATWFEVIVFTPLTLLYALFLYRILQEPEQQAQPA